jgi:elongation factor Ts
MANIPGSMVKELRDKTGAGMMDCKNALIETNGDMEAAIDWLRKKGISKAAKKAGRAAAEGLVGVAVDANTGVLLEVNAETDFVAKNEEFKTFVKDASQLALKQGGDMEKLLAHPMGSSTVQQTLTELVAKIGENMSVRRAAALSVNPGVVAAYVHNAAGPELGNIGVLVALKSSAPADKLAPLAKQIAMHVAAKAPLALTVGHMDKAVVDREYAVQKDIAMQSGKPEAIVDKMMEGRMRNYYAETVLLQQGFVMDDKLSVAKVLEQAGKDFGAPVEIEGFVRFKVGEGIEKADSDFADEVAQMAGTR